METNAVLAGAVAFHPATSCTVEPRVNVLEKLLRNAPLASAKLKKTAIAVLIVLEHSTKNDHTSPAAAGARGVLSCAVLAAEAVNFTPVVRSIPDTVAATGLPIFDPVTNQPVLVESPAAGRGHKFFGLALLAWMT
jgi:hypothetical protein